MEIGKWNGVEQAFQASIVMGSCLLSQDQL